MILTAEQQAVTEKLARVLMPYARERRDEAIKNRQRFVHYTSAEAALKIINSKALWMRNVTCMADFSEVYHGFQRFVTHPRKDPLIAAIDAAVPGVGQEAVKLFDSWWADTRFQTYITSISEHDPSEDIHGRLSMWRAFARGSARVALVINIPLQATASPLNVWMSPVAYFTQDQLGTELDRVIDNIAANHQFLRGLDRQQVLGTVFMMLVAAIVCLKHEGFHEEREWRLVYSPNRTPSPHMTQSVEIVDGVPQTVYKIPLIGEPPPELENTSIARLLDRVIIGPSPYPLVMYDAFVRTLKDAGVENASERVFTSGIPIRA
jgi:hypothetical protein